jgi:hypothetical protein
LESFVMLLGDGECGNADDDDDDQNNVGKRAEEKAISSHVKAAVQALIHIVTFLGEDTTESESTKKNTTNREMVKRVKANAFQSLSRYSLRALGITEDGLHASIALAESETDDCNLCANETSERYFELRDLIVEGLETLPSEIDSASNTSLQELARKIIEFEEESLGASLWQKRGKSRSQKKVKSGKKVGGRVELIHESLTFLPSPSEVQDLITDRASISSSIVQLLTSDGTKLTVLRDSADASIESSDPFLLAFAIQGYLHTASSLVSSRVNSTRSMISEITSWLEILISSDAMYLALCSLSVYIPQDQQDGENPTTFVEEIFQRTLDAYQSHGFHKGDVAKICLGLLGASALRYAEIDRIIRIVDMLEHSVTGYGGQHSFGAFYGLSIIAQTASQFVKDKQSLIEPSALVRLIARLVSFVVESLLSCFEISSVVVTGLLACLKSGMATSDLVNIVSKLGSDSIATLANKEKMALDLFMCCSVCLQSLAVVNGDLLVAVTYLLDSFEWGSGKGFALQSVLLACKASGVMTSEQIQDIFSGYITLFEGRTDTSEKEIDSRGLDELFYSLNGPYWRPTPAEVRQLILDNRLIFDEKACRNCLLAFVNSMTSVFCLGTADIWSLGQLDSAITGSDISDILSKISEMSSFRRTPSGKQIVSDFGIIIMGFLSSIKDIQQVKVEGNKSSGSIEQTVNKIALVNVHFSTLPRSTAGTLTGSIIDVIERLLDDKQGYEASEAKLARAIEIISHISVPGNYAYSFVEPLMKENMVRNACILFLCSQVAGRRRVYVEGHDFLALVTKMCSKSSVGLFEDVGPGSPFEIFIENFHGIIPKIHFENLNEVMNNTWQRCTGSLHPVNRRKIIHSFLSSMIQVLSSKVPSFKVLSTVRMFVLGKMFSDICNHTIEELMVRTTVSSKSTLDLFSICLKHIPLSLLDEGDLLKHHDLASSLHVDIIRVALLLELIKLGYFDTIKRGGQELLNVNTWLSRRLLSSDEGSIDIYGYRRVACSFAAATVMMNKGYSSSRRDTITSILDVLLLTKDTLSARLGLTWLSVIVAYWCNGNGSDSELSLGYLCTTDPDSSRLLPTAALDQFFSIMIYDLSYNLISVSRREKLSTVVSNYLHRIYEHWIKINVDEETIDCIRRAIIFEQGYIGNQDFFVNVASTILTKVEL